MPEEQSVTAAGIARLAGVGRAAVSNWRRRYPHFPRPVGGTETSPTFALAEVTGWLRSQGKLVELPLFERVWHRLEAHPEGLAVGILRAGEALRTHAAEAPKASAAADCPGLGELAVHEGLVATFDRFTLRYLEANSRQYTRTPAPTAALMAALAGAPRTVLDPACGAGGLLAAVAERAAGADSSGAPPVLRGQECDAVLARFADLRLGLRGETAAIRTEDALRTPRAQADPVDAVLCHPPFNERHWGHRELTQDPRWEYGVPARTDSELAWVQHALAQLRPGGTAVVLMPPAAATRRTGRRIRAALLRRGALRAVIALPAGSAPPHRLPLHLWVLRRPEGEPPADPRLLLMDASGHARRPAPDVAGAVLAAWRAFEGRGTAAEEPEVWAAVPVLRLLDEDVDLVPSRHLARAGAGDTAALPAVRAEFDATTRRALQLAPVPGPVAAGAHGGTRPPAATVGELLRSGALRMLPAGTPPEPGDVVVPLQAPEPGGGAYVAAGGGEEGRAAGGGEEGRAAGGGGTGRAAEGGTMHAADDPETEGQPNNESEPSGGPATGAAAEPSRQAVLRTDPTVLDAWFVAGFLHSSQNLRQAARHPGRAGRLDIRRLRLPRCPLPEQRLYAVQFRQLEEFRRAVHAAQALGERLVQGIRDGYADGRLHPPSGPDAEAASEEETERER